MSDEKKNSGVVTPDDSLARSAVEGSKVKVGIGGFIALVFAILFFSGLLSDFDNWITAFDFSTLSGSFGTMTSETANFRGNGGTGAQDGFLFAITLIPAVVLALGVINVLDKLGALRAAQKLLTPLMRPLLGVPGVSAFILVTGLQSTDAASTIPKSVYDVGMINEKERFIIVTWLFSACGLMVNYFGSGAALFETITVPIILPLMVIIVTKFIGSNIVRVVLNIKYKGADISGN